jgi:hypothetical protein
VRGAVCIARRADSLLVRDAPAACDTPTGVTSLDYLDTLLITPQPT